MHPDGLQRIADAKDLFEKITDGYYSGSIRTPSRPHHPRLSPNHDHDEVLAYAKRLRVYEQDLKEYDEEIRRYSMAKQQLHDQFKEDAIEYCGLFGHEKAEKAWEKAWEDGHDAGLASVVDELQELADIILD